ncbi:hypothetical protein AMTR_s00063p00151730 [Amborella trichopoda]|uniref:Uncharacterized protein n=1 Tax=Amborella trichopoda TaxID=13333 RepID=U5CSN9_AMBTC|nr:hypothetical protein AMTR_s00063p00151730 [Amborella trichopoda]
MAFEKKILMKRVVSKPLKSQKKTNTLESTHYPLIDYNLEEEENVESLMFDKSENLHWDGNVFQQHMEEVELRELADGRNNEEDEQLDMAIPLPYHLPNSPPPPEDGR